VLLFKELPIKSACIKTAGVLLIIRALSSGVDVDIRGKVVDSEALPIGGVDARLLLIGSSAVTDSNGDFAILDTGIISLEYYKQRDEFGNPIINFSGDRILLSFTILNRNQRVQKAGLDSG
jgi:hypothetical protein